MSKLIICISDSYMIKESDLTKDELLGLRKEFSRRNPQYYKLRQLGYSTRGIKPNIRLYERRGRYICLPRGDLRKIKKLLPDYAFSVVDERFTNPLGKDIEFQKGFKFWTEQSKAIDIAVSEEQGLILGECGSGKTEILLGIFAELGQKTLVVVDKIKLMNQWVERIEERFKNVDVKVIGEGKWGIGDITIGSQKTLYRHTEKLRGEFGAILCDEVHHFAAPTFQDLISKMPAKYRIGATATLKRKDQKQFLVYAAFGKVLHKITDADLKEEGKIFEIEMVVVPTEFKCDSYIQTRTNMVSGEEEITGYDYHALLTEMKVDELRNQLILKLIKREVTRGHKCLVMADRIAHCIFIKRLLEKSGVKAGLMVGEKEFKEETDTAPDRLSCGKISVIVVSPLVQEGFDLPELDRGFIINPSANNEGKLKQQTGRIKRIWKGKKSAVVYYFWDKNVHRFDGHLKKIRKLFPKTKVFRAR